MVREIHAKDFDSLSKKDRYYLEKALDDVRSKRSEALCNKANSTASNYSDYRMDEDNGRQPKIRYAISAVVIQAKGKPLVRGNNSYTKTHPKQKRYALLTGTSCERSFLHAEIHAISRAIKPIAIYIARSDRQGNPKLAKPCPACRKAIEDSGIRRIVHT